MDKKISSALISVFYKDGLEPVVRQLNKQGVTIYSTGGTQKFTEDLGIKVIPVEKLTSYPSILGGRVKTLHPLVFGGILGRRSNETDVQEMQEYNIPALDLVIVDLYPFEETVAQTNDEKLIIEKIDVGGPSMIRAAAKNFVDVTVVASKSDYHSLVELLEKQNGTISLEQRKAFAAKAFEIVAHYDVAIAKYFNPSQSFYFFESITNPKAMRYGENPHQSGVFYGDLNKLFEQLHGKELSYNNLVDVDAAVALMKDFKASPTPSRGRLSNAQPQPVVNSIQSSGSFESEVSVVDNPPPEADRGAVFAIIKHTNVCGIAQRSSVKESWDAALAGDPESAFGGVLVCNNTIDKATAEAISEIFFEVLMAAAFDEDALVILKSKKNRILLQIKEYPAATEQYKTVLNGVLVQGMDEGNYLEWTEAGERQTTAEEKEDLLFANLVCKHLKSNAIALVKNKQLIGKGCGQTSRIDALRQALEKAAQFNFNLTGAVMASDAFFPFNDCVKMGHGAGITAFSQPGGSIRDKDSIDYCRENNLAMVLTGMRHFRH